MQMAAFVQAWAEVAGRKDTAGEEAIRVEAEKANSLWDQLMKALAEKKAVESEYRKLQGTVRGMGKERDKLNKFVELSRAIKDELLDDPTTARTEAVSDFLKYPSYSFLLETNYDVSLAVGFEAAIGQLRLKGLIPENFDPASEGIDAFNNPGGSKFEDPEGVADSDLFTDEFVELVVEENDH